jgi:hypothetical protein
VQIREPLAAQVNTTVLSRNNQTTDNLAEIYLSPNAGKIVTDGMSVVTRNGSDCFQYNSLLSQCTVTCWNNAVCPSRRAADSLVPVPSMVPPPPPPNASCGCGTYNVFIALQYATFTGVCNTATQKGNLFTFQYNHDDDYQHVKHLGVVSMMFCFTESGSPLYVHQVYETHAAAVAANEITARNAGPVQGDDDPDPMPWDVMYTVLSFQEGPQDPSEFATPSYCHC